MSLCFISNALYNFLADINECLSSPCEQRCTNTPGSFVCSCNNGYRLDNNGLTCSGMCFSFNCTKEGNFSKD